VVARPLALRHGAACRGDDELAAQSVGINLTATKVSAMTVGGAIAGLAGGLYAHYTTHIEHLAFGVVQSIFALAYPIIAGCRASSARSLRWFSCKGFLVEGLRGLGDWRNLLFGALIIVAMVVRPSGFLDAQMLSRFRRRARKAAPMLDLKSVSRYFGGVRAVDQLDLTVGDGEIVGLIGPNGSGKSTTVNLITGLFPVDSGTIYFRGEDIGRPAYAPPPAGRHRAHVPEHSPVRDSCRCGRTSGSRKLARRTAPHADSLALAWRPVRRPQRDPGVARIQRARAQAG
jgi:hypothetical protein